MAENDREKCLNLWRAVTAPHSELSLQDWAEQYADYIPYSPKSGSFVATPIQAAVMHALDDESVREAVICACTQSGKTLSCELFLAHQIVESPTAIMWLDINDATAKDTSATRLQPLFENIKPVRACFCADRHKMTNTCMQFNNGAILWVLGANNISNLQRRSIRYLFMDECWRAPEGRMAEAYARTSAYPRSKCVYMSQGSFEGDDFCKKFKTSDMRVWHWRCPHCGALVEPRLEQFGDDGAQWTCPHCAGTLDDSHRSRELLSEHGEFVVSNPEASAGVVGFNWSAWSVIEWRGILSLYKQAMKAAQMGKLEDIAAFYQKRLAQFWSAEKESEFVFAPDASDRKEEEVELTCNCNDWSGNCYYRDGEWWRPQSLSREELNSLPMLRLMTIDVQGDHFYYVVRMWSDSGDSLLWECGRAYTFAQLDDIRTRSRTLPGLTFIDCGYRTQEVYIECARRGWKPLMGTASYDFPTVVNGVRVSSPVARGQLKTTPVGNVRMWAFAAPSCKDILLELRSQTLRRWQVPTFGFSADVRDWRAAYWSMINAEHREPDPNNRGKYTWRLASKNRQNHFLDCEVMQVVGATLLKLLARRN